MLERNAERGMGKGRVARGMVLGACHEVASSSRAGSLRSSPAAPLDLVATLRPLALMLQGQGLAGCLQQRSTTGGVGGLSRLGSLRWLDKPPPTLTACNASALCQIGKRLAKALIVDTQTLAKLDAGEHWPGRAEHGCEPVFE